LILLYFYFKNRHFQVVINAKSQNRASTVRNQVAGELGQNGGSLMEANSDNDEGAVAGKVKLVSTMLEIH
jgi:hypothetical protein